MSRFLLCALFASTLCFGTVRAADVMVFAAASLADALQEIRVTYEADQDDRITYNFESSSKLARQIVAGAPADLFFSADEAKMDQLQDLGLIVDATRASVLSNTLVIVTPSDDSRVAAPADLLKPGITRLALAFPDSVPAGIYAKAWLTSRGWWDAVAAKVIPSENVRAALAAVESGNVDAAIVYRTDVRKNGKARIAYEVPPAEAPSITYPVALVTGSKNEAAARRFLAYLRSPDADAVFTRHGFSVLPPTNP